MQLLNILTFQTSREKKTKTKKNARILRYDDTPSKERKNLQKEIETEYGIFAAALYYNYKFSLESPSPQIPISPAQLPRYGFTPRNGPKPII